jgi:hypothetical protein
MVGHQGPDGAKGDDGADNHHPLELFDAAVDFLAASIGRDSGGLAALGTDHQDSSFTVC